MQINSQLKFLINTLILLPGESDELFLCNWMDILAEKWRYLTAVNYSNRKKKSKGKIAFGKNCKKQGLAFGVATFSSPAIHLILS